MTSSFAIDLAHLSCPCKFNGHLIQHGMQACGDSVHSCAGLADTVSLANSLTCNAAHQECIRTAARVRACNSNRSPIEAHIPGKIIELCFNRTPGHVLTNNGLCLHSCAVRVTIFSTPGEFHSVSNFTLLHTLTLATHSYALLSSLIP